MRSIDVKSTEVNTEKGLKIRNPRIFEYLLIGYSDTQIFALRKHINREVKQNALVNNAEREGMKQRISQMHQFFAEQTQDITEYDEQLVRRLIEKITVYEEKVTVEFKSATSVDVRR